MIPTEIILRNETSFLFINQIENLYKFLLPQIIKDFLRL